MNGMFYINIAYFTKQKWRKLFAIIHGAWLLVGVITVLCKAEVLWPYKLIIFIYFIYIYIHQGTLNLSFKFKYNPLYLTQSTTIRKNQNLTVRFLNLA